MLLIQDALPKLLEGQMAIKVNQALTKAADELQAELETEFGLEARNL